MNIDVNKYIEYRKALQFIKDARPHDYTTFREMIKALQQRANKVL